MKDPVIVQEDPKLPEIFQEFLDYLNQSSPGEIQANIDEIIERGIQISNNFMVDTHSYVGVEKRFDRREQIKRSVNTYFRDFNTVIDNLSRSRWIRALKLVDIDDFVSGDESLLSYVFNTVSDSFSYNQWNLLFNAAEEISKLIKEIEKGTISLNNLNEEVKAFLIRHVGSGSNKVHDHDTQREGLDGRNTTCPSNAVHLMKYFVRSSLDYLLIRAVLNKLQESPDDF